ncbi:RNA-directed DNA methylation 4 [Diospyros lotus]|uniref:RNA-directed DNA methylation 4 n=1 Tax=Diospyros lotus TaxID=55363 RepID=UPI002259E591|nr:RNA-directed DNA methylation 4 [Diospyros lotus]
MTDAGSSSSAPSKNERPIIVRVKRKAHQSPLEAFWLEINERPLKRPLIDFQKLSISDSPAKVKELKTRKVFVQHVETVSSSEVTSDVFLSFRPKSADGFSSKGKNGEQRCMFKNESKQDQLLVKAKQKQEVLSKNARFEQIWRSRTGKREAVHDSVLHEMCRLYDVVRIDAEEKADNGQQQESSDLEDHRIMSSYLPLLREFIPSAAAEIESNIHDYLSDRASNDCYVYDFYAMKDDVKITEDASNSFFPLVQVDEDDEFYDGPADSEYETDDSNAEDNPMNDYPDEETSENVETSEDDEESKSKTSCDESEEIDDRASACESSDPEDKENWSDHAGSMYEDDIYGDDFEDGDVYYDEEYNEGDDDAIVV